MLSFPGLGDPLIALSLLAIEPELKGLLIGGPPGTGKTTIVRATEIFWQDKPFINIPLNCTMDRLVGGIDLERSSQSGRVVVSKGLIAEADGGALYVDQINLLAPELINAILIALMSNEFQLEREGISKTFETKFVLIGTFDPSEGILSNAISERVAFIVYTKTLANLPLRLFIAKNYSNGLHIAPDIIFRINNARKIINQVIILHEHIVELCKMANLLVVEGNRNEIFAALCAKANAALHQRIPVTKQDIDLASKFVYLNRMSGPSISGKRGKIESKSKNLEEEDKMKPNPELNSGKHKEKESPSEPNNKSDQQSPNPEQKPLGYDENTERNSKTKEGKPDFNSEDPGTVELPEISSETKKIKASGRHVNAINSYRGRHIRSIPGNPNKGRIDILATLKSAALSASFRTKSSSNKSLSFDVQKSDFRIKQFSHRSGLLFIFVVDGSGSMAINRLGAARKSAISLLQKAYVFRDKVAMMYFSRNEARIILAPEDSISKARSALKRMPAGGKTPLSAALVKTIALAKQAESRWDVAGTVMILFTDGRANQPLKPIANEKSVEAQAIREVQQLSFELKKYLTASIFFDTKMYFVPNSQGKEIASWLDAKYIYLPKTSQKEISYHVKKEVDAIRKQ